MIGKIAIASDPSKLFSLFQSVPIRVNESFISDLKTSGDVVFHGSLEVGNNLTGEDDAILFRSTVGDVDDNVTIGARSIVVGVILAGGAIGSTRRFSHDSRASRYFNGEVILTEFS